MKIPLISSILFTCLNALPPLHHLQSNPVKDRDERQAKPDNSNRVLVDVFPTPEVLTSNINFTMSEEGAVNTCDNETAPGRHMIYCSGKLLEAVMYVQLYTDSKTFVDRPLKANRTGEQVYSDFLNIFPQDVKDINKNDLQSFVDENFDEQGHELQSCTLTDWTSAPTSLEQIVDPTMRKFALRLNDIWRKLCRQVKPMVKEEPERFSLIYVPHNFIIPGGRFREFYYWDAYWIIKGLISSGMMDTTKSMLKNFQHIVDTIGFIPNGGRIYYLQRSQPPLFAAMVYEYYVATKDTSFLRDVLPTIEKEYDFWKNNRSIDIAINGSTYSMFQYRTPANVPRPESFREDVKSAASFQNLEEKRKFWSNIGSAAESGWDFSSRWFRDKHNLTSIEITNIVPVDLNAFLCYNLNILSFFHGELGNSNKESNWHMEYIRFRDNFKKVFYVEEGKGWYDYNIRSKQHNKDFYASMAVPLFTGCYSNLATQEADDLFNKMADLGAFSFDGGVPTSVVRGTNQQWDYPNGWSPLNHMIIEGLRKSGNPRMQQKAYSLAEKWVLSNFKVFGTDKAMWEKYNVASIEPRTGGGGEYDVQAGFGWSNGVILDLLTTYGDRMRFPDINAPIIPALSSIGTGTITLDKLMSGVENKAIFTTLACTLLVVLV